MEKKVLKGSEIKRLRTLGSWYDKNMILVYTDSDSDTYRIDVDEFLKIDKPLKFMIFKIIKKRVRKYLEVAQ